MFQSVTWTIQIVSGELSLGLKEAKISNNHNAEQMSKGQLFELEQSQRYSAKKEPDHKHGLIC
jgi:hypothetical protein